MCPKNFVDKFVSEKLSDFPGKECRLLSKTGSECVRVHEQSAVLVFDPHRGGKVSSGSTLSLNLKIYHQIKNLTELLNIDIL